MASVLFDRCLPFTLSTMDIVVFHDCTLAMLTVFAIGQKFISQQARRVLVRFQTEVAHRVADTCSYMDINAVQVDNGAHI